MRRWAKRFESEDEAMETGANWDRLAADGGHQLTHEIRPAGKRWKLIISVDDESELADPLESDGFDELEDA